MRARIMSLLRGIRLQLVTSSLSPAGFHATHPCFPGDVRTSAVGGCAVSASDCERSLCSFILPFASSDDFKSFLIVNYWLGFIGLTVFVCVCMLLSCSNVARSCFPWNFILFMLLVRTLKLTLTTTSGLLQFSRSKVCHGL